MHHPNRPSTPKIMNSAGVVDPTVLAVFGIPEDTDADIINEILANVQDGSASPELHKLWEDHFLRKDVDEDHPALTTLDRIRDEMTLEGIEKNAKAKSTFTTRQSENTLFILWLYHHERDLLEDEMASAISDAIQNVDYSSLMRTGKRHGTFGHTRAYTNELPDSMICLILQR